MTRIAVIGGGIAGTSAAYELAADAEVTVFEQESTCGFHSTGRSAALFTECYGDPIVRHLAIASRPLLEQPPRGFTDDPLVRPRALMFIATAAQETALTEALPEYRSMVPAVHRISAAAALERCPVLDPAVIAGGIVEPEARDIDVHALHLGFQRGIRERGGRIVTSSGVIGLSPVGDGWIVDTGTARHRVDVVVDAAGAWCDAVGRMAGSPGIGLVPKRRTAFTFAPPAGSTPQTWPMVLDIAEQFYFRPEGVQVLASPCDETPMEPHDVRHEEIDVALGISRVEAVTTMRIRSVAHAWAGLRSFVADHRPVNGWDPDLPGFYWVAGQGGFGIKTSPAMGRFAAGMILHGAPPPDLSAVGVTAEALGVVWLRGRSKPAAGSMQRGRA
jgi:D-arginine dehydrogenase